MYQYLTMPSMSVQDPNLPQLCMQGSKLCDPRCATPAPTRAGTCKLSAPLYRHAAARHRRCILVTASSRDEQKPKDVRSIRRMPIFPLAQVAMPWVVLPLNIFEARYRVLFNTLLSGTEGLEEGLVNHQSPFCGSRTFGMCLATQQGLASVGTTLHIDHHKLQKDGRMFVTSKGRERFRIQNIVEQTPVLICDVEMLQGDDSANLMVQDIAAEVRRLFKDLVTLNAKIKQTKVDSGDVNFPELDDSPPEQLSYHIASMFPMNPILQQSLLEEEATIDRLRKERDLLQNTLNYTSATSALQSALSKPSETVTEVKPAGSASASSSDTVAADASTSPAEASESSAQSKQPDDTLGAEGLTEQEDKPPPQTGPD